MQYLQSLYQFTCDCPACFDRTDPGSFAAGSHPRRWKMAEISGMSFSDQGVRLKFKSELTKLITSEGLCIPDLGIA